GEFGQLRLDLGALLFQFGSLGVVRLVGKPPFVAMDAVPIASGRNSILRTIVPFETALRGRVLDAGAFLAQCLLAVFAELACVERDVDRGDSQFQQQLRHDAPPTVCICRQRTEKAIRRTQVRLDPLWVGLHLYLEALERVDLQTRSELLE